MLAVLQGQRFCPMCEIMAGPWGWVMMILVGIFWVLVIGAVLWLLYRIAQRQGWLGEKRGSRPEQVLKERYARGEIDRETYQRMLEELRGEGDS